MREPWRMVPRLSEDWLSVIIGLVVVLIVALGALTTAPWPLFGWFR